MVVGQKEVRLETKVVFICLQEAETWVLASGEDPKREAPREGKGSISPPKSGSHSNGEVGVTGSHKNSSEDHFSATNVLPEVKFVKKKLHDRTFQACSLLHSGGEVAALRSVSCCYLSGAPPFRI